MKNALLKGTFILTLAGLATRIIGFFYKIYLSNTLGAEKLGVYQLVFPIYGICFTLYASGIQTAISQMVANEIGRKSCNTAKNLKSIMRTSLFTSFCTALVLSVLLYRNADTVATNILLESDCAGSLRVLSYVFPFCGITACINGYYYGLKKAGIPAATQLIEQFVRVLCVFVIATYIGNGDTGVTCELAVLGVVIGEIASNIYNIFSLCFLKSEIKDCEHPSRCSRQNNKKWFRSLMKLSIPLTSTRLIISLLHSLEAILIPSMLKKSGLSSAEALSIYGVLTGMSMPFILFPSTITNSLAVLLLPTVSEASTSGNNAKISRTTSIAVKYSLIIGILSTGIFIIFGNALGDTFFHDKTAGVFLVIMSWLCPFIYISTTLGSIINGLGKTHITFINTVIGLGARILFIIYLTPQMGISGYLIGLLISQLVISVMDYIAVYKAVPFAFDAYNWLVKPTVIIGLSGYISQKLYYFLNQTASVSPILLLFLFCCGLTILYLFLLSAWKVISRKDLR